MALSARSTFVAFAAAFFALFDSAKAQEGPTSFSGTSITPKTTAKVASSGSLPPTPSTILTPQHPIRSGTTINAGTYTSVTGSAAATGAPVGSISNGSTSPSKTHIVYPVVFSLLGALLIIIGIWAVVARRKAIVRRRARRASFILRNTQFAQDRKERPPGYNAPAPPEPTHVRQDSLRSLA